MSRDDILKLAEPWLQYRDSLTPTMRGDDIVQFAKRVQGETLQRMAERLCLDAVRVHDEVWQ